MVKKVTGIMIPKELTDEAADFFRKKKMARTEMIKQIWVYIKKEELNEGKIITLDDELKAILCTRARTIEMTQLPKLVGNCFKK